MKEMDHRIQGIRCLLDAVTICNCNYYDRGYLLYVWFCKEA